MQITTTKSPGGGFITLELVDGSRTLNLTNTTFARTTISDHEKLFSITNSILAKLSSEKQSRIFDIYEEINDVASRVKLELTDTVSMIAKLANELYSILDLTRSNQDGELSLNLELMSRPEYHIPPTLVNEYGETHKRELTYLRDDYIGLCALAEAMRFALPIWLTFMIYRQNEIGTAFKEYEATGLIYGADVFKTTQITRLNQYVEAIIGDQRLPLAAIHAGLSDSEAPDFMAALALIRKIAIGETQVPTVDLICNVSNYTRKTWTGLAKRFDSTSRVIEPKPMGDGGDDNTSKVEEGRTKERLPLSRYEETKYLIRTKMFELVELITGHRPTQKHMADCTRAVKALSREEINNRDRLLIMLMVIRRTKIAPNLLDVLDTEYRTKLLIIATASLSMGEYLPALNLLISRYELSGESLMMGGSFNSAISTDTLLKLNTMYYIDEPELTNAAARRANLAHAAITKILTELSEYDLTYNLPRFLEDPNLTGLVDRNDAYGESLSKVMMDFDYADPYTDKNQLDKLAETALSRFKAEQQNTQ